MGWDAFGLPAENAALERGIAPNEWTEKNIDQMKSQLRKFLCTFDWQSELKTCSPDYYRWTQFIFLKMYETGIVFQKEVSVITLLDFYLERYDANYFRNYRL